METSFRARRVEHDREGGLVKRASQRVALVEGLIAICAAARLRNATRVAEAPRLVGERQRGYRHNLKKEIRK
jgi:hypothetical protein